MGEPEEREPDILTDRLRFEWDGPHYLPDGVVMIGSEHGGPTYVADLCTPIHDRVRGRK